MVAMGCMNIAGSLTSCYVATGELNSLVTCTFETTIPNYLTTIFVKKIEVYESLMKPIILLLSANNLMGHLG